MSTDGDRVEDSRDFPVIGTFTRRLADAYSAHLRGSCNRTSLVAAFKHLGLTITTNQAGRLLHSVHECHGESNPGFQRSASVDQSQESKESHSGYPSLGWADFCVLTAEFYCRSHPQSSGEEDGWESSLDAAVQSYLVPMETKRGRTSMHEVFLGGSCNPTTWRKDIAIPALQEGCITYYNPQVEEWTPDLMELEEQAKNEALLLFFVVDNQTRALASMVEIAYLIGCGKPLVIVLNDICEDSPTVAGCPLSPREVEDLNRGRALVRDLATSHGIICESTVEEGIETAVRILNRSISYAELKQKLVHPQAMGRELGEQLRILKSVFSMYDTKKDGTLSEREACLALRSLRVISTPSFPLSLSHFLTLPPSMQLLWQQNGLSFMDFSAVYAELRYQGLGSWVREWMRYFLGVVATPFLWIRDWIWTTPTEKCLPFTCDVFLGGSCGDTTWRKDISIPILRENGVSYFDPQVSNWTSSLLPIERMAKRESCVRLLVITGSTLSVAALAEAGYYVGKKMKAILCVSDLASGVEIEGMQLGDAALKDYNRGRCYLGCIANKSRVPVFKDVSEATRCCVRELKALTSRPSFSD